MITEQQVINFLKQKDTRYINNLMNMLLGPATPNNDRHFKKICPRCGSSKTKKNGKDSSNEQRYLCNDCGKSFGDKDGTLLFNSHFSRDEWINFIDYEISNMKLEDEAHFLNTSVTTCFYMRHKLYAAASEIIQKQKLSEEVEIDAEYLSINLKGTKPENMPRYSKTRGNTSAYRGISHHKICVICAIDSNDNIMMNISGLGSESYEKLESLQEHFEDVTLLIGDSKSSNKQFANLLQARHSLVPTDPNKKHYLTEEGNSLASVNELMNEVQDIIKRTHGFSTRYLQGYLDFNILKKQIRYKYKRTDRAKELYKILKDTSIIRNEDVLATTMPISLKEAYYEYHYGIFANQ